MKNLELEQMEVLEGGANAGAVVCGIGLGLFFSPFFYAGAVLIALGCLTGDS